MKPLSAALAALIPLLAPAAFGQTLHTSGLATWDTNTVAWATDAGGPYDLPWTNGARAAFETIGGAVTLVAPGVAVLGLTIDADGVVLNGPGRLTFTNGNEVAVAAGLTTVISAPVTAPSGIVLVNQGTLEFSGSAVNPGQIVRVEDGALRLRDANAFQAPVFNQGFTVEMTGLGVNAWMYTGAMSGDGTWRLTGSGLPDQSAFGFNGDNRAFTGSLLLDRARFQAAGVNALPSGPISVLPGGELLLNLAATFTNHLTIASNGWANTAYPGGIGALRVAANAIHTGTITLAADARIGAHGDAGSINGTITGSFALSKGGTGTVTLGGTASNTYDGPTHVRGGVLLLAKPLGVDAVRGDLRIGDGSGADIVQLAQSEQVPDTSSLLFTSAVGQHGYFKLMGRTETVAGIQDATTSGVIENVEGEGLNPGDGTLILNGAADQLFNGYLRNRAAGASTNLLHLVKNGPGSLTLTGNRVNHTGTTTLNNGSLVLVDSTAFNSPIQNNGRDLTFSRTTGGGATYGKSITGSGRFFVQGTGALNVGDLTLSATNTAFTADTVVENARLVVGNPNFLPSGPRAARNGGQFFLAGTNQTYPQNFTLSGTGWKEGTYPTGLGALRLAGGARYTGTLTLEGDTRIGNHASETAFFLGTIQGGHDVEKFGTGVLYVDGDTGHTGPITVTGGYLVARHAQALGSPSEPTRVRPGATLQLELASTNVTSVVITGETALLEGLGMGGTRGALGSWTGTNTWDGPVIFNSPTNGVFVQIQRLILPRPITETAPGSIFRKQGGGMLVLTGPDASAWTGRTELENGVLALAKDPGVRAITNPIKMGGPTGTGQPTLRLMAPGQLPVPATMTCTNTWGNWSRFDLNGHNVTLDFVTNTTGALVIQNEGAISSGATNNPPSAVLTLTNVAECVLGAHVRDADDNSTTGLLQLTKRGPGRLVMQRPTGQAGRINYSGTTRLEEGTLRLVDLNGAGGVSFNSPLEVGTGTTLEIHSTQSLATRWNLTRPLSGPGTIVKTGAGVFGLTNVISPSGGIEVREGRLMCDFNASDWSGCTAQVTVSPGAEFDMRADPVTLGSLSGAGTVTNSFGGSGTDLLTLGAGNHDGVFSGILRATGDGASGENRGRVALRKTGGGTQAFSGGVQIFGPVTVTQGVLRVSGWVSNPATATDIGPAAALHLDGGAITTQVARVRADGLLHGCGRLAGDLVNDGTVVLDCPAGGLEVFGNVTNHGRMRLINGNALTATGTFTNNGILDLLTGPQTLPPNFVNNGIVVFASSLLALDPVTDTGAFRVSIDTQPGHDYQLLRAESPAGPWAAVGAARAGTGARLEFTDPNPGPELRWYYRFGVNP